MTLEKRFKTKLEAGFVALPFDVRHEFGSARPPVKVSINGYSYRSTVSVYGGEYFIPVRKSNQEAAGIKLGDTMVVAIALDTEIRTVTPPPELQAAFAKSMKVQANWQRLSYTAQKEHADAVLQAKKEETRMRRVDKILSQLRSMT